MELLIQTQTFKSSEDALDKFFIVCQHCHGPMECLLGLYFIDRQKTHWPKNHKVDFISSVSKEIKYFLFVLQNSQA